MDYNQDWDWEDAGEHILISKQVIDGTNTFAINVPASAKTGFTYARFRLSPDGGLAPDGPATGGEVEDYRVFIGPQQFTKMSMEGGQIVLTWSGAVILQQAPAPTGPWTVVPGAVSPHRVTPTGVAGFFRLTLP